MAFKRIVANSEEDLEKIVNHVKDWFKNSNYTTEEGTEKRKFQDPDTKAIVEKNIDVIKATDNANDKFSTIKFIPMKEKGEMKVEIGGEGEAAVSGKISNQMKGKGKLKSYSKDKKVALGENTIKKSELKKLIKEQILNELETGKPEVVTLSKYLATAGKTALSSINDINELESVLNMIFDGMNTTLKSSSKLTPLLNKLKTKFK